MTPSAAPTAESPLNSTHPLVAGRTSSSSLVRSLRGERTRERAVWFMRQAGRSLPEYREARAGTSMLDACLDPDLAAEITLQPVRRHGVDAAVFFSDIVIPLRLAGVGVEILPGTGPVIADPIRTTAQIDALPELDEGALAPISDAVARTVAELGATPLIGFAGAPFTVASYLVEGGPSKEHLRTRALMLADPGAWRALTEWVARVTGAFLRAQAVAGASALQLFDSWAGYLSAEQYRASAAPASARALEHVADLPLPVVHFGVGTAELLRDMLVPGVDALGIDHRLPLDAATARVGANVPLQGNIDPATLFAGDEVLSAHLDEVLARGGSAAAHVVNLGHGVPPNTDPDVLTRLVAMVHDRPDPAGS